MIQGHGIKSINKCALDNYSNKIKEWERLQDKINLSNPKELNKKKKKKQKLKRKESHNSRIKPEEAIW